MTLLSLRSTGATQAAGSRSFDGRRGEGGGEETTVNTLPDTETEQERRLAIGGRGWGRGAV